MKVLAKFNITGKGLCYYVPYFEGWEHSKGKEFDFDGTKHIVKDISRNVCSSFFTGTNEEWEKRNVYIMIDEKHNLKDIKK